MSENSIITDDNSQTDVNIQCIEKDTERIRTLSKIESEKNNDKQQFKDDVDDLSKYTHDEDGVKVLNDTTSINRKAIFHDLDRLKHWRESMDQSSEKEVEKEESCNIPEKEGFPPIMENNMDIILNSLPDLKPDDEETNVDEEAAIEKLNKIEEKLARKYSLKK